MYKSAWSHPQLEPSGCFLFQFGIGLSVLKLISNLSQTYRGYKLLMLQVFVA